MSQKFLCWMFCYILFTVVPFFRLKSIQIVQIICVLLSSSDEVPKHSFFRISNAKLSKYVRFEKESKTILHIPCDDNIKWYEIMIAIIISSILFNFTRLGDLRVVKLIEGIITYITITSKRRSFSYVTY